MDEQLIADPWDMLESPAKKRERIGGGRYSDWCRAVQQRWCAARGGTTAGFSRTTLGARQTDAFRAAGRQRDYRSTIMVTTLSPRAGTAAGWFASSTSVR